LDGLTEGRIVHYVLESGRSAGEHRPAIVVKLWEPKGGSMGCAQLQVFTDGSNGDLGGVAWRTSVMYSADARPGTWHWIERA